MKLLHHQLRIRLDQSFVNDDELNAFVIDYYPLVARQFSAGMNRTAKLNLLFEHVDVQDLINAFNDRRSMPDNSISGSPSDVLLPTRGEMNTNTRVISKPSDPTMVLMRDFDYSTARQLLDDLLFLTVARQYLFPWERGCLQRFNAKVGMSGLGAANRLRSIGVEISPEPRVDQIDNLIEEIREQITPHMAAIRSALRI